ncbi:uncharacterized protein LOC128952581 [Oppia nitens]|uniref:uncharacterized protein LOC128952581 n=1 Tax=Oppia nitens TaxID=1686743 RepID=UPI0023DC1911|nr:uncharacterized protein LOC128952581 [Oppia nitens]
MSATKRKSDSNVMIETDEDVYYLIAKECMDSLIDSIEGQFNNNTITDVNCETTSIDANNDEELCSEIWDDLDFDTNCLNNYQMISNHSLPSNVNKMCCTSFDANYQFKQQYELLSDQLTTKATAKPPIDATRVATQLLLDLDAINDAIIGLKHRLSGPVVNKFKH